VKGEKIGVVCDDNAILCEAECSLLNIRSRQEPGFRSRRNIDTASPESRGNGWVAASSRWKRIRAIGLPSLKEFQEL
jgi:hypothetical protein